MMDMKLEAGYWMLGTGYWILDAGYWMTGWADTLNPDT